MIRAIMLGRLGNNLFQYAFGRTLAEKHGCGLVLDATLFNDGDWKQVSNLRRLPLKAKITRSFHLASRTVRKLSGRHPFEFFGRPIIRENGADHRFDPSMLEAPSNSLLAGWFQSPRYFDFIEAELRKELRLDLVVDPNAMVEDALNSCESVAVHVRRTDFLVQPVFQVCGESYYQRAMMMMRERLDRPRFFIFSDDPEWCRAHFTGADEEVVELPGSSADPLIDLHFMSLAKHHIIADSSYSWWGAWLGLKDRQMVLTPDRWFASEIHAPIEERLLPGWEAVATQF